LNNFYNKAIYFCRLKDHIFQSENGQVYLSEIEKKLRGQFSTQEIGRAMRKVFKGTIIKSVRNKEFWAKITKLYMGVEWKGNENFQESRNQEAMSVEKSITYSKQSESVPETENYDSSLQQECIQDIQL
jgi:hypothetical protein